VTGFAVDPAHLQRCDAQLLSASLSGRDALARLEACAGEVFRTWGGSAGGAFRDAWGQWAGGMTAMLDALEVLAGGLGASGSAYAATDAAVRARLRS
jgi:WXG100 family type VII secretion target